jgi:protein-S-isoprenylcysteine O-methyltransferase Ste14
VKFWTFGGEGVRWLGIVLFAVGGAPRIWPLFALGRRFSGLVAIQSEHRLVTSGIYRFIRNPSYLGMLAAELGWAFAFRSWVGVLLTAVLLLPLVARIRAEEALLHEHFGAEFDSYCAKT